MLLVMVDDSVYWMLFPSILLASPPVLECKWKCFHSPNHYLSDSYEFTMNHLHSCIGKHWSIESIVTSLPIKGSVDILQREPFNFDILLLALPCTELVGTLCKLHFAHFPSCRHKDMQVYVRVQCIQSSQSVSQSVSAVALVIICPLQHLDHSFDSASHTGTHLSQSWLLSCSTWHFFCHQLFTYFPLPLLVFKELSNSLSFVRFFTPCFASCGFFGQEREKRMAEGESAEEEKKRKKGK